MDEYAQTLLGVSVLVKSSQIQSADYHIRALVARAVRTVEDRQDLLRPVTKRLVGYAVAKAVKIGRLPRSDEWW